MWRQTDGQCSKGDAVMRILVYLFSFEGRINRLQFLAGSLSVALIAVAIVAVSGASIESRDAFICDLFAPGQSLAVLVAVGVAFPLLFWVSFALQAKRLHDLDITAYWIITMVAVQALLEYYGDYGDTLSKGIGYGVLAWLVFMPAARGRNQFGDAPQNEAPRARLADVRGRTANLHELPADTAPEPDAQLQAEACEEDRATETVVSVPVPPPEPIEEGRAFGRRKQGSEPAPVPLPADRLAS